MAASNVTQDIKQARYNNLKSKAVMICQQPGPFVKLMSNDCRSKPTSAQKCFKAMDQLEVGQYSSFALQDADPSRGKEATVIKVNAIPLILNSPYFLKQYLSVKNPNRVVISSTNLVREQVENLMKFVTRSEVILARDELFSFLIEVVLAYEICGVLDEELEFDFDVACQEVKAIRKDRGDDDDDDQLKIYASPHQDNNMYTNGSGNGASSSSGGQQVNGGGSNLNGWASGQGRNNASFDNSPAQVISLGNSYLRRPNSALSNHSSSSTTVSDHTGSERVVDEEARDTTQCLQEPTITPKGKATTRKGKKIDGIADSLQKRNAKEFAAATMSQKTAGEVIHNANSGEMMDKAMHEEFLTFLAASDQDQNRSDPSPDDILSSWDLASPLAQWSSYHLKQLCAKFTEELRIFKGRRDGTLTAKELKEALKNEKSQLKLAAAAAEAAATLHRIDPSTKASVAYSAAHNMSPGSSSGRKRKATYAQPSSKKSHEGQKLMNAGIERNFNNSKRKSSGKTKKGAKKEEEAAAAEAAEVVLPEFSMDQVPPLPFSHSYNAVFRSQEEILQPEKKILLRDLLAILKKGHKIVEGGPNFSFHIRHAVEGGIFNIWEYISDYKLVKVKPTDYAIPKSKPEDYVALPAGYLPSAEDEEEVLEDEGEQESSSAGPLSSVKRGPKRGAILTAKRPKKADSRTLQMIHSADIVISGRQYKLEVEQGGNIYLSGSFEHNGAVKPFKRNGNTAFDQNGTLLLNSEGRPMVACLNCNKPLADPSSLYRHRKIHLKEMPHVCPFGNCKKVFIQRFNMKQHLKTHRTDADLPGFARLGVDMQADMLGWISADITEKFIYYLLNKQTFNYPTEPLPPKAPDAKPISFEEIEEAKRIQRMIDYAVERSAAPAGYPFPTLPAASAAAAAFPMTLSLSPPSASSSPSSLSPSSLYQGFASASILAPHAAQQQQQQDLQNGLMSPFPSTLTPQALQAILALRQYREREIQQE